MFNEDDVNDEADSGQSDGEENGEVEQSPVTQQPQHQVNYYNTTTQGQTLNGVALNVIPTSVPVQQLLPEQIPVQVQQHIVSWEQTIFFIIIKLYSTFVLISQICDINIYMNYFSKQSSFSDT